MHRSPLHWPTYTTLSRSPNRCRKLLAPPPGERKAKEKEKEQQTHKGEDDRSRICLFMCIYTYALNTQKYIINYSSAAGVRRVYAMCLTMAHVAYTTGRPSRVEAVKKRGTYVYVSEGGGRIGSSRAYVFISKSFCHFP